VRVAVTSWLPPGFSGESSRLMEVGKSSFNWADTPCTGTTKNVRSIPDNNRKNIEAGNEK
jgi:hypothetical protein